MQVTKCPAGPVIPEALFQRYNHDRTLGSTTDLGELCVDTGESHTPSNMTMQGILAKSLDLAFDDFPAIDAELLLEYLETEEKVDPT